MLEVITGNDSSKSSNPNLMTMVPTRNNDSEIPHILTNAFIQNLKESCYPDCI